MAALAAVLSAVFGAGDQYLGSLSRHPWAADASLLSAPWLLLAFLAGATQRNPWRAALLGFACTYVALIGYGVMTLSPVENAHLTARGVAGFIRSEDRVVLGGVITGPLFGWLGQQWRTCRVWLGALLTAAAFCFEPLARIPAGRRIRSSTVLDVEVAVGLAMVGYVALRALRTRSSRALIRPD